MKKEKRINPSAEAKATYTMSDDLLYQKLGDLRDALNVLDIRSLDGDKEAWGRIGGLFLATFDPVIKKARQHATED